MKKEEIRLIKTCNACPEQYNAFVGDKQVGYLRLRHGEFKVVVPDVDGKIVYRAYCAGDGEFEDKERSFFLNEAKKAIIRHVDE